MSGPMRRLVALAAVCALVVLVPAPSAMAGPHGGTFRGETSQALAIVIRVNEQEEIRFVKVVIDVPGDLGCVVTWKAADLRVPIAEDGTFVVRGQSGLDTLVVRGEFVSRRKAEGTAKTSVEGDCSGGKRVTWRTTRVQEPVA